MEFFIKKNATLPLLKLQVVKNGRLDYNNFMSLIEQSALFFSMVDIETGVEKIVSRPAGFVEKTNVDPNAEKEYYLYYQFQNRDTNRVGRYEGQFMLRSSDGVLILPIREKLYINVQESYIADDLEYDSCYISEFPCCVNGPTTAITINLNIVSVVTVSSVKVDYIVTSSDILTDTLTLNFTNTLGQLVGTGLTISIGITINAGSNIGFGEVILPDDYYNLDGTSTFSNISVVYPIAYNFVESFNTIFPPQPTPTPSPVQQIIDAILTDETDVYVEVGSDEYLSYVDPTLEYLVNVYIASGSVITTFTITSNIPINEVVSIPLSLNLGLIGGGSVNISATVIIPVNQTSGQTITNNSSLNFYSLNQTGELFIDSPSIDFPINFLANQIQFEQPPTPTPTPTITPTITPTSSETPTPTPTETLTPTPTSSETPTPTPTITPTSSETPTPTPTQTPTPTPSPVPNPFISIWRTTTPNETINLPYNPSGNYSGTIDWGDGNIIPNTYTNRSHTYVTSGDYIVTIDYGIIDGFSFGNDFSSASKLIEVNRWGCLGIGNSVYGYFSNCSNLILTGVTDTLNLAGVTNLSSMFNSCVSLTTVNNMDSWDVSNVTSMTGMFQNATLFNQDINSWDVSNVTNVVSMFKGASSFNQPLNSWDISSVGSLGTYEGGMFQDATSFNQDINGWDVSNVTDISFMFKGASSFNQPLSGWNVSSVTTMIAMFSNATSFNQNINNWNVSGVTNMVSIFNNATSFNQPLNSWVVSNVTIMNGMFGGATSFNQPLSGWNVSNVTSMFAMFTASVFNQDISNWDVSSVISMQNMFSSTPTFNQDISGWDVVNVTNMAFMFQFASSFNQDLSSWCVTNIPSLPTNFDLNATSWVLPKPIWGTCPP